MAATNEKMLPLSSQELKQLFEFLLSNNEHKNKSKIRTYECYPHVMELRKENGQGILVRSFNEYIELEAYLDKKDSDLIRIKYSNKDRPKIFVNYDEFCGTDSYGEANYDRHQLIIETSGVLEYLTIVDKISKMSDTQKSLIIKSLFSGIPIEQLLTTDESISRNSNKKSR